MGAILGQGFDQLWSGVTLEPFHIHRTAQQQFQQLLNQGPVLGGDSVAQPHVHQGPPTGSHKLTQQFRFGAFQNLYVDTLGYKFLGELRHQVGKAFDFVSTTDATVWSQKYTEAHQKLEGVYPWHFDRVQKIRKPYKCYCRACMQSNVIRRLTCAPPAVTVTVELFSFPVHALGFFLLFFFIHETFCVLFFAAHNRNPLNSSLAAH